MDWDKRIVILSGGVGGAKLVDGFARLPGRHHLTVIGNVGDDIEQHGLWVSPDLDIVTYTLAGLVDQEKGWGYSGDTFDTLQCLRQLGEDTWMNLGDRDLGTHIWRTKLRREGVRPTEIARRLAQRLGVDGVDIIPPTDDFLQTMVAIEDDEVSFQEYFVRLRCQPEPLAVRYAGVEDAVATPDALEAMANADLIVIAPSNPLASVGPILAPAGMRDALRGASATRVGVSPLIGGKTLKGPADRMLQHSGYPASPRGVAAFYEGLLDSLWIDETDRAEAPGTTDFGITPVVAPTVMRNPSDRVQLANRILTHTSQAHA